MLLAPQGRLKHAQNTWSPKSNQDHHPDQNRWLACWSHTLSSKRRTRPVDRRSLWRCCRPWHFLTVRSNTTENPKAFTALRNGNMSANHQENDTRVKDSHLLLVDCGVPSSGSRTLSIGGAPRAAPPLFKKERRLKRKKDHSMSSPPMTAPPAGGGRGLTCSGSRTHPSPKRSQVGVHVVLPQCSIASFQNFWNQSKFVEIGRKIHSQSRIKASRVRMSQLISPLVVISA